MKLGTLKKVEDLRKIWKVEDRDFSTWMAKDENLELLCQEIGINIKVLQREASVGKFSVDILAEEPETGRKIVIENQLEKTDHDHLGKIITYASGYEAEIIIWIAKRFRDEHRQALDWLNENTKGKTNFFGIIIELWQIDNSPVAPKFNVVSQPNEWAKALAVGGNTGVTSEIGSQQIQFTSAFIDYAKEYNTSLRLRRPQPSAPAYYSLGIGSKVGHIAIKIGAYYQVLKIDFYFKEKPVYFDLKENHREEIQALFFDQLEWDDMEKNKGATFGIRYENFVIEDETQWPAYFKWLQDNAENLQTWMTKYLQGK